MADNSALHTSISDLNIFVQQAAGNSVTSLRIRQDLNNVRLVSLNKRLQELYANELVIQGNINNNLNSSTIIHADSPSIPTQAYNHTNIGDPTPINIVYDKHNIYGLNPQLRNMMRELYKIENEIQYVLTSINSLTQDNIDITNLLNGNLNPTNNSLVKNTAVTGSSINSTVSAPNSVGPISNADIIKDQIARKRYEDIYKMYNIASYYSTIAPPDGDSKIVNDLIILQQTFSAFVKGFPNAEFLTAPKLLILENPGANNNLVILAKQLSLEQNAISNSAQTKIDKDTKKFINDLVTSSVILGSSLSTNVSSNLSPSISLKAQNSNYVKSLNNYAPVFYGSFGNLPSFFSAVEKKFQLDNIKLYGDLPLCPSAPIPNYSAADASALTIQTFEQDNQVLGMNLYQLRIDTTSVPIPAYIQPFPSPVDWVTPFIVDAYNQISGFSATYFPINTHTVNGQGDGTTNVVDQYVSRGINTDASTAAFLALNALPSANPNFKINSTETLISRIVDTINAGSINPNSTVAVILNSSSSKAQNFYLYVGSLKDSPIINVYIRQDIVN